MLVRYKTTKSGKRKKLANIYTHQDHNIGRSRLDHEALSVTRRLSRAGYEAYVVGGAVRDLMIGKKPKDFDVVTDAQPRQIRRLFRNSRIIGRRFQLVHVYFGEIVIEVSTFRNESPSPEEGIFGTMSEDVMRRDYTMNALYYDPEKEQIIDYVGGYDDIRNQSVKALIPVESSFSEDPVRMIRAIRYASTTGFKLQAKVSKHIKKRAELIASCPVSRLTEELFKILSSGGARGTFDYAYSQGLLQYLLPGINGLVKGKEGRDGMKSFTDSLISLDNRILNEGEIQKSVMIEALVQPFVKKPSEEIHDLHAAKRDMFLAIKSLISPLTPPNIEVEKAAQRILGVSHRKRRPRRRGGRRPQGAHNSKAGQKNRRPQT